MKNLKIAVSFIGLLISFSFVNAGAMEKNIKDSNQQGVFSENELDVAGKKCSVRIDAGYKYKIIKDKYLNIKKFIEDEIIKYEILDFNDVAFNGTHEDLYKFYKKIYGGVLNSKSKNQILFNIKTDDYFKLFSPEKLKKISLTIEDELRKIVLEFRKDIEFKERELNRLQSLESNESDDSGFIHSDPFIAMIKQIVLIYFEFVKNDKNVKECDADCGYMNGKMKLDYKGNIADSMKEKANFMEEKMKSFMYGEKAMQQWLKKGVEFDTTSRDLLRFYKMSYDMLYDELKCLNFIIKKPICFIFDPENIKDIFIEDDDSSVVFKFDIANIKKLYNDYINGNYDVNYSGNIFMDKIFENFDSNTKNFNSTIFAKQIILSYIKFAKEAKAKNCKNLIDEYNKEIIEKEENELGKLKKFENQEFKMKIASENECVKMVSGKIEQIANDNIKGILFDGSSKDLLKFYKVVFNDLVNKNILTFFYNYPEFMLFSPENVEYIAVKDDGLNAVFKFNIENIIKQIRGVQYKKRHIDSINGILDDFNTKTIKNYFEVFPKQIISFYVEGVKKKKEELKKQNDKEKRQRRKKGKC